MILGYLICGILFAFFDAYEKTKVSEEEVNEVYSEIRSDTGVECKPGLAERILTIVVIGRAIIWPVYLLRYIFSYIAERIDNA